jgi:hypothetical protein
MILLADINFLSTSIAIFALVIILASLFRDFFG